MGGKLLILAPVVLLVVFVLYFLLSYIFEQPLVIKDLKVTNVTDTSVAISWLTDKPTTGYVVVADKNNFDLFTNLKSIKFSDDRELTKNRYTHHVTVSGLTPESNYYFNVVGNLKSATYAYPVITTAKTLETLKTPDISYAELSTDSDDYIVYAELTGSQMVSVPLSSNNTFTLDKALVRTSGLDTFVSYKDKDIVSGQVVGGTRSSEYLFQVGSDTPAKINLDFKNKVSLNNTLIGSVSAANSLCESHGVGSVWDYPSGSCPSGKANFRCPDLNTITPLECVPVSVATPAPVSQTAPTAGVTVAPTASSTPPATGECAKAKSDGLAGLSVADQTIVNCKGSGSFGTCNNGKMYVSGGDLNGFWINCPANTNPGLTATNTSVIPTMTQAQCDVLYADGNSGKSLDDGQIRACAGQNSGTFTGCNNGRQYVSGGKFNGFWVSCSATDPSSAACTDPQTNKGGNYYANVDAKTNVNTPTCLSSDICDAQKGVKGAYEVYMGTCRLKASASAGGICYDSENNKGVWNTGLTQCVTSKECATALNEPVKVPSASGCVQAVGIADGTVCFHTGNSNEKLPGISKDGKCVAVAGANCSSTDTSYIYDAATHTCVYKQSGECQVVIDGKTVKGNATASGCASDAICNARTANTFLAPDGSCKAKTVISGATCTTDQGNTGHYYPLQDLNGTVTTSCLDEIACYANNPFNKWNGSSCVYDKNTSNAAGKKCILSEDIKNGNTVIRTVKEESVTYSQFSANIVCRKTASFCAQLGKQLDTLANACVAPAVIGLIPHPVCTVTVGTPPVQVTGNLYGNDCRSDAICVATQGLGSKFDGVSACTTPEQDKKAGAPCGSPADNGKLYDTGNTGADKFKCNSPEMCAKAASGGKASEWEVTSVGECRRKATPSGRLSSNLTNLVDAQAAVLGVADESGVTKVKVSENGIYSVEGTGVTTKEIKVTTVKDGVAEIKFFNDANSNGLKDDGEEYITEPVSVKLEKTSDVVKYDLTVGWNLVAFNFVQSSFKKANELVNEITSQGGTAITVATYRNGKWLSFIQRSGKVLGDNFDIVPGEGYFIRVTKATTLDVGGTLVKENSNVYLSTGWNLLGFRTSADKKASDIIDGINKNTGVSVDTITRYVASKYENVVKDNTTLYGEDFKMESNRGYFVRAKMGGKVVSL